MQPSFSVRRKFLIAFFSSIISAFSGVLYFETTKNAPKYAVASTIASNLIINFLAALLSTTYILGLHERQEYKKAVALFLLAGFMYAPQVLIAVLKSSYSIEFTVFAATAAFFSGAALNAYSLIMMGQGFISIRNELRSVVPYRVYRLFGSLTEEKFLEYTVLIKQMKTFEKMMRLVDYSLPNDEVRRAVIQEFYRFQSAYLEVENTVSTSRLFIMQAVTVFFQLGFSMLLLYSTMGYACGAEDSLRKNVHFSPLSAAIAANFLMSPMYVLNIKGAIWLIDIIKKFFSIPLPFACFQKKTNDELNPAFLSSIQYESEDEAAKNRQDKQCKLYCQVAIGLASILIASFSGASASGLYETTCPQSRMRSLMFSGGSKVIASSEAADNAIYIALAFYTILCFFKKTSSVTSLAGEAGQLLRELKNTTDSERISVLLPPDDPQDNAQGYRAAQFAL